MLKRRLLYIDCFRGFAMLMVVYSHVLTFCLNNIEPSPLGIIFRETMLPSFFFISGFCSYTHRSEFDAINMVKKIWSKTRSILIPTFVMFMAFMYYSHKNPLEWVFRYDKAGYWFTLVLFQIFVLFYISKYVAFKCKNLWIRLCIMLCLPMLLLKIYQMFVGYNNSISIILEIIKIKEFYPIFYFGFLCHQLYPQLKRCLNNNYFNAILFIVVCLIYCNTFIISLSPEFFIIVVILFFMFIFWKSENWLAVPSNTVGKVLLQIGNNSLAVYFVHFFLLFNIPFVDQWLMHLQSDNCFGMMHSCNSLIELIICGSISICISIICIWISKLMGLFPFVVTACLGGNKGK